MKDFTSWDAGLHSHDGEHLEHYGVLGMKWGIHRALSYKNADGTLTKAGRRHWDKTGESDYHYHSHATNKYLKKARNARKKAAKRFDKLYNEENQSYEKADARSKTDKKFNAMAAKAQQYLNRAKRSDEVDRGEEEYARNISTGKAVGLALLGGSDRLKGYAQYRAMAGQSGKDATGKKVMAGIKAYNAGSAGSRLRKAAYIRQDEGKKGLGQKVFRLENKIEDASERQFDVLRKRRK